MNLHPDDLDDNFGTHYPTCGEPLSTVEYLNMKVQCDLCEQYADEENDTEYYDEYDPDAEDSLDPAEADYAIAEDYTAEELIGGIPDDSR